MSIVKVHLDIPGPVAVVLDQLAKERCLTRTGVVRQALGILHAIHEGAKEGYVTGLTKDREKLDTLIVGPL